MILKRRPWTPKEGSIRWRLYLWIMSCVKPLVGYKGEEPLSGAASFRRLISLSWASSAEILCSIFAFASFSESSSRRISDADIATAQTETVTVTLLSSLLLASPFTLLPCSSVTPTTTKPGFSSPNLLFRSYFSKYVWEDIFLIINYRLYLITNMIFHMNIFYLLYLKIVLFNF